MTEEDLPATYATLATLADQAYGGDTGRLCELLGTALGGGGGAVVAVGPAGELLGVAVVLLPAEGVAELSILWVTEEYRRRGLARAMLSMFTPLWGSSSITAEMPAGADIEAAGKLLENFAFARAADGSPTWRTRRVRRTTGRSSLAPVRSS